MNNRSTFLSVCLLFITLGFSSCKKDYTCVCKQSGNTIQEDYSFIINDTRNKAKYRCYDEETDQEFGFGNTDCRLY